MIYPSVVKNYKVYSAAGGQYVGLSDIVLPKIQFERNTVKGAGIGGSINLPISGNLQPMSCTLSFHTNTLQSLQVFNGNAAQIRCATSLQVFDTIAGQFNELPEEVLMTVADTDYDLGKRDSSTKAVTTIGFSVLYLALIWNSTKYWELDPFANICIINGVNLNAQTNININ